VGIEQAFLPYGTGRAKVSEHCEPQYRARLSCVHQWLRLVRRRTVQWPLHGKACRVGTVLLRPRIAPSSHVAQDATNTHTLTDHEEQYSSRASHSRLRRLNWTSWNHWTSWNLRATAMPSGVENDMTPLPCQTSFHFLSAGCDGLSPDARKYR